MFGIHGSMAGERQQASKQDTKAQRICDPTLTEKGIRNLGVSLVNGAHVSCTPCKYRNCKVTCLYLCQQRARHATTTQLKQPLLMHDPAEIKPSQQQNDTKDDEKKLVTAPEAKQVKKINKESEKSASAFATTKPTGASVDMDETKKDNQNDNKNKETSLESGINSTKGVEGGVEAEDLKGDDGDVEMKEAPSGTESAPPTAKQSEPEAMAVETGNDDYKQESAAESSDKMTSTVNAGEPETTKPQNESPTGDVDKKDDYGGSYSHDKPKEKTTTEKNGGNTAMEGASTSDENKSDAKLGGAFYRKQNCSAREKRGNQANKARRNEKGGCFHSQWYWWHF